MIAWLNKLLRVFSCFQIRCELHGCGESYCKVKQGAWRGTFDPGLARLCGLGSSSIGLGIAIRLNLSNDKAHARREKSVLRLARPSEGALDYARLR
jgi:hypothetical protein